MMADESNDIRSTLHLDGDPSGADKAMAKINRELKALGDVAARSGKEGTAAINRQLREMESFIESQRRVAREYDTLSQKAQKFGKDQVGDISTSLGSLASVGSGLGGGVGSEALGFGGDIAGAIEYAGRFKDAIKDAGEAAAASSGLVGNLASGLQAAVPGLGAAGSGLAATAAVALPFAAALGTVTLALAEADKQAQATNEAYKAFAAVREAERKSRELDTEQARQALADAKQRAADNQAIVDQNSAILDKFYQEAQSNIPVIGDLAARFHDSRGAFNDLRQDTTTAKDALKEANAEIAALERVLQNGTTAENDRAAAIEKATQDTAAAEKALEAARQQHATTIAQLEAQEKALGEAYTRSAIARSVARGIADADAREDEKNRATDAAEDLALALEQQAAAHESAMLAISKRGDDAIIAAQKALADKQLEAAEAVAAIQDQLRQDTIKAEAAFNKQRLRAQREYRQALAALESQYEKQRLGAILDNDVLSFLESQSQFKSDRRNLRSDRKDARQDAREDYEAQRAAAAEAAAERILQIQNELSIFTASTAAKIAQIEQQTAADLEAAQKAFDEKQALDQKLRDIQTQRDERDSQIKADRQQRDRDREDAAAAVALQASLARIEEQQLAQDTALNSAIAKANEFKTVVESIQLPRGIAPTPGNPVPQFPGYGGFIPQPPAPTTDHSRFYEDPRQGAVGQSGGGNFGAGLNGISSAGAARGGMSIPAPNIIIQSAGTDGGRQLVYADDVKRAFVEYTAMLTSELGMQEGRRG